MKAWWAILSPFAVASCVGAPALTPHLADAAAPQEYYRMMVNPAARHCVPGVPLLDAAEVHGRPFHELSTLSATCYPGAPSVCRQILSERGCELHADAVILQDSRGTGTPPGASNQSAVSQSGRAVKWDTAIDAAH